MASDSKGNKVAQSPSITTNSQKSVVVELVVVDGKLVADTTSPRNGVNQ